MTFRRRCFGINTVCRAHAQQGNRTPAPTPRVTQVLAARLPLALCFRCQQNEMIALAVIRRALKITPYRFHLQTRHPQHQLCLVAPQIAQRKRATRALRCAIRRNFLLDKERLLQLLRQINGTHAPLDYLCPIVARPLIGKFHHPMNLQHARHIGRKEVDQQ